MDEMDSIGSARSGSGGGGGGSGYDSTHNILAPCTLLPDNSCFLRITVTTCVHQ